MWKVVPDFDVLREQQIVNAREILRFEIETLTVQLPSHMRVMSLDVWQEDLPRTTTRKLKRFEILERLRGRAVESPDKARERPFAPEEAAWATDPAVAPVLQAITQITSAQQLRPGDNLELDLGLDSMERVELLTHLERVFGRSISDEVSSRIYTVGELVSAVQAGQPATPAAASHAPLPWDVLLHGKPAEDPAFAALLRPRPVLNLALFLVIKSVYLAAWLLFRLRVSGRDDLPRSGPFLLCPNHQSYVHCPGRVLCRSDGVLCFTLDAAHRSPDSPDPCGSGLQPRAGYAGGRLWPASWQGAGSVPGGRTFHRRQRETVQERRLHLGHTLAGSRCAGGLGWLV
jgi:long-chain acyl-CoA synthetase